MPVEGEGDALGASSILVEPAGTVVKPSQDARHRSRTEGRTEHQAADLATCVEQIVRVRPQFVVVNREQPYVKLSAHPSQEVLELALFERIPFPIQEGGPCKALANEDELSLIGTD
jgi:hypothetical protein